MTETGLGTPFAYFYYPRPVGVVGTRDPGHGRVNLAPATWTTPLSSSPPLLGICLSPQTHTHHLVLQTGELTLSLVRHSEAALVAAIGELSGRDVDKVAALGLQLVAAEEVGGGYLAEAYVAAECALLDRHRVGDQTLLVCEVLRVHARPGVFDEAGVLHVEEVSPLLYLGGGRYLSTDPGSLVSPARSGVRHGS